MNNNNHYHLLLYRSQNATTTTSCHTGQRYILCTSNQCWLAGQVHL